MHDTKSDKQTLTNLAEALNQCTSKLVQHTKNRSYLNDIIRGNVDYPMLRINPVVGDDVNTPVIIDTHQLPAECTDNIISHSLVHEATLIIDCWAEILDIATAASKIITELKKAKEDNISDEPEILSPFNSNASDRSL